MQPDFEITGDWSIRQCDANNREFAQQVFSDAGASSKQFEWTAIKQNQIRTVFKVTTDSQIVFAKLHTAKGLRQRFKQWFVGDPAQREYETSRYARAHNVPCVHVFATAVSTRLRPSVMSLSHAINHAEPLAERFLHAKKIDHFNRIRELATSTAQLFATAHNARFLHADDHPGNILVEQTSDGRTRCIYVDVYGSRCGTDITMEDAANSLASIGQWFTDRATRTMRLAMVKRYVQLRGWPTDRMFLESFVRRIHTASLRRRSALYRKRDNRITKTNAHFRHVRLTDGWQSWITLRFRNQSELTGVVPPRWPDADLTGHLQELFGLASDPSGTGTLTNGPDHTVRFTSNLREAWSWRWFGSPLRRRYMMACMAMNRDIPTALPAGAAELRQGFRTCCAKQIEVRPPQCVPIQPLMRQLPPVSRRALLERIGRHLAMTFDRGLVITNISPDCIEATCFNGRDIPIWVRIVGRSTKMPLPMATRNWMLGRLASEARRARTVGTIEMTRVLRACIRSSFPGSQWKPVWLDVLAAMIPDSDRIPDSGGIPDSDNTDSSHSNP
ncbi:MAG: hypothetical protein KDA54_08880 [Phycisphaerales bacterium]|nr:hypothetical protein [Phycisphaerales bacterium]